MIIPGFPEMLPMVGAGFDPNISYGTFIEGGYYLGQITDSSVLYALIVAPKSVGEIQGKRIRTTGGGITTGATSQTNGPGNTAIMVAGGSTYESATFCDGLVINGYSDWYLPAQNELTQLYNNRAWMPGGETFETDDPYWSSTERPSFPGYHWNRNFSSGAEDGNTVNSLPFWTRAVRRVEIG